MRDDFAVFILSHGRANKVVTVDALKTCGYTGVWYILVDDEDDQYDLYCKNYGKDRIIKFSKAEMDGKFDIMDNFDAGRQVPTFARNALPQIAKDMGYTYFLELEDDYELFSARTKTKDGKHLCQFYVRDLDSIVDEMIEFLDVSGAWTVTFAQDGDFLGGLNGAVYKKGIHRKAMQTFFCRTDTPWQFLGRFNDDVNAYVEWGKKGHLFMTVTALSVHQPETQKNSGGITDAYKTFGTYTKSFYSVMLNPSCVKIADMGQSHRRIHHSIDWKYAVPVIISSKFRNYTEE